MSIYATFQTTMLKYNKLAKTHYNKDFLFKIEIDIIEFSNSKEKPTIV